RCLSDWSSDVCLPICRTGIFQNPQSRRLLLLLFFLWSLFLCSWRGSGSFTLFLLLSDNFWSCSRSFSLNGNRFFFHNWSHDGKGRQIRRHLCGNPGRQLNVAYVNGIADI